MEKGLVQRLHKSFEDCAHEKDGVECWLARELQGLLGYTQWRNFESVIDKARIACETAGQAAADRFADVCKMVEIGSQARCSVEDSALNRFPGTHQLVQRSNAQVMLSALDDRGSLFSLTRFQHLHARMCSISLGFAKSRLTGFEAGSTCTAQATVQAAYGRTRLDRPGRNRQQAAGSAGEQE